MILLCRVLVFSDTHEQKDSFKDIVSREDYDFALFAGDFENYYDIPKPFYFIRGNHDYQECRPNKQEWVSLIEISEEADNFNHIKTGELYKQTIENREFKISGINGNFSPKNFKSSKEDSNKERHFSKEDFEKCISVDTILDFFISHEAPKGICDLDYHSKNHYGVFPIRNILDILQPYVKFFIVGHLHNQQICSYKDTIVFNPGYGVKEEFSILDFGSGIIEFYRLGEIKDKLKFSDRFSQTYVIED